MKEKNDELKALSSDVMSFDLDNITTEELERRLELAIAVMPAPSFFCQVDCSSCPNLTCCSNSGPKPLQP
jgi:hypothetical protein